MVRDERRRRRRQLKHERLPMPPRAAHCTSFHLVSCPSPEANSPHLSSRLPSPFCRPASISGLTFSINSKPLPHFLWAFASPSHLFYLSCLPNPAFHLTSHLSSRLLLHSTYLQSSVPSLFPSNLPPPILSLLSFASVPSPSLLPPLPPLLPIPPDQRVLTWNRK